jgi:hypothetical protein
VYSFLEIKTLEENMITWEPQHVTISLRLEMGWARETLQRDPHNSIILRGIHQWASKQREFLIYIQPVTSRLPSSFS